MKQNLKNPLCWRKSRIFCFHLFVENGATCLRCDEALENLQANRGEEKNYEASLGSCLRQYLHIGKIQRHQESKTFGISCHRPWELEVTSQAASDWCVRPDLWVHWTASPLWKNWGFLWVLSPLIVQLANQSEVVWPYYILHTHIILHIHCNVVVRPQNMYVGRTQVAQDGANQHSSREGGSSGSPNTGWGALGCWWLLGMGETVFSKGVVSDGWLHILELIGSTNWTQGLLRGAPSWGLWR